jgi:hypothetical protein
MILAGALLAGLLLALAVHMIGQRFGLDLGALWSAAGPDVVPVGAALAWWITASGAFGGGYLAASLLAGAASGELPTMLRYLLIGLGVLVLAGAGQAASAPSSVTSASGVLAGVAALLLGAAMAFCGAQLALREG